MQLLKGAVILSAAALISKLLGAIYRIPYQNIVGDTGLYVYNQVYPVYTILLTLATFGFPSAISKTVSERLVLGDHAGAKRVFRISAGILFLTGLFFFLVLFLGAPLLAVLMANDPELALPIRSIAFALLIVPVMSAIRGYFQGHQYMVPTATSQVVEQFVRVGTILILAYWFITNGYSVYYAGAGAVFGAVAGAFASLLVLIYFWVRFSHKNQKVDVVVRDSLQQQTTKEIIIRLVKLAVPMAAVGLVLPLMQGVDSFTVKNMLDLIGVENSEHITGLLSRGQPLVQFAAFVAAPLSLALLPAISEANARRDRRTIQRYSELAMRLTLFIALPASVGLATIIEPLNVFLYKTNEGSLAIAVLSFSTIFSTMGVTTGGILQGVGRVGRPARNLFIGVIFKLVLNIALIPLLGITGAALATVIAYFVSSLLNVLAVNKYTGTGFTVKDYVTKPLIAVAAMAAVTELVQWLFHPILHQWIANERIVSGIVVFVAIVFAMIVYGIMLLRLGAIRARDLDVVPKLARVSRLLKRLKLLRE